MGMFSDLIELRTYQDSAVANEQIYAYVFVQNKTEDPVSIRCLATVNGAQFMDLTATIGPGLIWCFAEPFYMPAANALIRVTTYAYGSLEDTLTKTITLTGAPPPPAANIAIVYKWINKGNLTQQPMPHVTAADNQSFEVGVSWKNNGSLSVQVKPSVVVTSPTGAIITGTPEASFYSTAPGQTLQKEFNISTVTVAGAWNVNIRLIDNAGTLLAEFNGVCLQVSGPTGQITNMWFNKGSKTKQPFGGQVDADNETFEVGITYKNVTSRTVLAGIRVEVFYPSGASAIIPPLVDYTGMVQNESLTTEYNITSVDRTGEWTVKLTMLEKDSGVVMALWPSSGNGLLFVVSPVASISELKILAYRKKAVTSSVELKTGDILQIDISFKYSSPAAKSIDVTGGLYIFPGFDYPVPFQVPVVAGTDITKLATLEVPISASAGLKNQTYDIMVEIGALDVKVSNAVAITGMAGGIFDSIGSIVTLMVVMMMMQMMNQPTEFFGGVGKGAGAVAGGVAGAVTTKTVAGTLAGARAGAKVGEKIGEAVGAKFEPKKRKTTTVIEEE